MDYHDFLFKPVTQRTTRFAKNKKYFVLAKTELECGASYTSFDIISTDEKGKFILPEKINDYRIKTTVLKYSKILNLPIYREDKEVASNEIWKIFKGVGNNFDNNYAYATLKNNIGEIYAILVRTDKDGNPLIPDDVEVIFSFNFKALGY